MWYSLEPSAEIHAELTRMLGSERAASLYSTITTPPPTTARVNTLICTAEDVADELRRVVPKELQGRVTVHEHVPDIVVVETIGPVQRSHESLHRMWVSRRCGEAVLRGAHIFAPGVMAAAAEIKVGDRVAVFADIDDSITKGFFTGKDDSRGVYLGNGIANMDREYLFHTERVHGVAVDLDEPVFIAPHLNGVMEDKMFLQNLPSAVVAHVLNPQPGERVLDLCASPGGKTTHIATLMQNVGQVFAIDKSYPKVREIERNAKRLGIDIIVALRRDAVKYRGYISTTNDDEIEDGAITKFGRESFDRVLLDAPCSAMGVRPRLKFDADLVHELGNQPKLQKMILKGAAMLLKPGGALVYSTCTLSPDENERIVRFALSELPLELEAPPLRLADGGWPETGLSETQTSQVQRFDPWGPLNTPGFFCAAFRKYDSYR